MVPFGAVTILWYLYDSTQTTLRAGLCGCYSVLVGLGIMFYESNYGTARSEGRFPWRALAYLGLSIFLFFTISTTLCGVFLLLVCVVNFVSTALLKESYDTPPVNSHAEGGSDLLRSDTFFEGLTSWAVMIKQQNKTGAILFVGFYTLINAFLFGYTVNYWSLLNATLEPAARLSDYGPWSVDSSDTQTAPRPARRSALCLLTRSCFSAASSCCFLQGQGFRLVAGSELRDDRPSRVAHPAAHVVQSLHRRSRSHLHHAASHPQLHSYRPEYCIPQAHCKIHSHGLGWTRVRPDAHAHTHTARPILFGWLCSHSFASSLSLVRRCV